MKNLFRRLLPAWVACVLLPLPAIFLWDADEGVPWRFGLFFIGCASFVAYAFRTDRTADTSADLDVRQRRWRKEMIILTLALLAAGVLFSSFCLAFNDPHDFVVTLVAASILIPSLCVVPFLTLVTRKPAAAVVFSIFLVACMKFLGGVVVVLVYGWHASEHGYTAMSWIHPNLLVWLFWFNTSLLCLSFYCLGKRRFCRTHSTARLVD